MIANVRENGGYVIRFDGKNQDVSELSDFGVRSGSFCADFFGESSCSGRYRVAGDNLFGRDEFGTDKAFGEGCGPLACAQETDGQLGRHGVLVTGRSNWRKWKTLTCQLRMNDEGKPG